LKHELAYNELLKGPVNVTWEITGQCNLQCRHCLSAGVLEKCDETLDFIECCRFIDDLDRMDVFQINFGGGEPFLREDFLDILEYAHTKGITTCVSTNGTTLTESLVKELAKMELLYVQVSLDGANAATNDLIRGHGTFERIISGIELLNTYHFPHASTNTVVTGINFSEILDIYELGRRYGVKTRLSRFRPSGNAKKVWNTYHLEKNQLSELSEFLSCHRNILTGDSFFSITAEDRRELGLNMCGAARMTCAVLPDGSVYPCAFLQDSFFRAGNVRDESLETIWKQAPSLNMIRHIRIESCERCGRFNQCHGGCPAVAYFLTRSVNHSDPECMTQVQQHLPVQESNNGVSTHAWTI
jgi:mycofactocin biosynthetic radical S-adenosylmethionine protein MftC